MKNNEKKYSNIIIYFIILFFTFSISEIVFTINHRDVLSSYLLKSSNYFLNNGNSSAAFYLLTGGQATLSKNDPFEPLLKSYMATVPKDHNLSRIDYELAILAENIHSQFTEVLLKTALNMDSSFGYWYVELSNFYFSQGEDAIGLQILMDCNKYLAPKKQCAEYLESYKSDKKIMEIGFLKNSIKSYYDSDLH